MPTTTNTGLRYPASSVAPNVPQDIQNLATDLDVRVFPANRPYIDCYLRRSDGSNILNATSFSNPTYGAGYTDLKVYPVSGAVAGTWDTNWSGAGLACTVAGWYTVTLVLATAASFQRWVQVETRGTETQIFGGADAAVSGYGTCGGSLLVRAPSGIQVLFESYTGGSGSSTVDLRTSTGSGGTGGTPISKVRVAYAGPL